MNDLIRKNIMHHLAARKNLERNIAGIATVIIFPAIFAILGAYTPDLRHDYGNSVFWIWAVIILVFLLFAWRFNPTDQTAISLIVENEQLEDQIDDINKDIDRLRRSIDILVLQSNYSNSIRAVILENTRCRIQKVEELSDVISEIAAPLYLQGEFIFDFGSSELWNFAVYLYSNSSDILVPVWREKSNSHPSKGKGRSWKRGEGHVGKAFVDRRPIITGDARQGDAFEFSSAPPDKTLAYDKTVYVSFASIPIGPLLKQDDRPYGVIVGTSDRPGRFDTEKAGILMHVAGAIAATLITGNLDIDALWSASDTSTQGAQSDENGENSRLG